MTAKFDTPSPTFSTQLVRARAKVLAREDREMRAALIRLRREACLSQRQVADLIGVTQQAVQKLERYDSDPKLSTIRRYANAVGALIDHRVTPDLGQSAALAYAPRWDTGSEARVVQLAGHPRRSASRTPWTDGKPVVVSLAG